MAANENIIIDLKNYRSNQSDRVPEGEYLVTVKDVSKEKSRAGNDMIVVWLEIIEGEEAGMTIVDRLTLSEKAMFRVVNFMKGIGEPVRKERLSVNLAGWRTKQMRIRVEDGEPYNGEIKSEVRGYIRVRGLKAVPGALQSGDDLSDLPDPYASEEGAQSASEAPEFGSPTYSPIGGEVQDAPRPTGKNVLQPGDDEEPAQTSPTVEVEAPEHVNLDEINL